MATRLQITCINKPNHFDPHSRITHVGGYGWRFPLDMAIAGALSGTYEFYVIHMLYDVPVTVQLHNGSPYLKTVPDGTPLDNLLFQKECPIQ
jgi:hypothetical protein